MKLGVRVSVGVRTLMEKVLYELACEHAAHAEAAGKSDNHNDELKHTIRTVILAAACLEAFINQEGIRALGEGYYRYDKGQIDIWGKEIDRKDRQRSYPSLETKWCEVTERIGGKQFSKARQPFQGFHRLVDLRNEILHYKGMSGPPVHVPSRGNITPERARFRFKAAQDAVKSTKGMLKEYHILTCKTPPVWIE